MLAYSLFHSTTVDNASTTMNLTEVDTLRLLCCVVKMTSAEILCQKIHPLTLFHYSHSTNLITYLLQPQHQAAANLWIKPTT